MRLWIAYLIAFVLDNSNGIPMVLHDQVSSYVFPIFYFPMYLPRTSSLDLSIYDFTSIECACRISQLWFYVQRSCP